MNLVTLGSQVWEYSVVAMGEAVNILFVVGIFALLAYAYGRGRDGAAHRLQRLANISSVHSGRFTEVAYTANPGEAQIWIAALLKHGIHARLQRRPARERGFLSILGFTILSIVSLTGPSFYYENQRTCIGIQVLNTERRLALSILQSYR